MSNVISNDQAKRNISANVRRLLSAHGWPQARLASEAGENVMTISHLVRGARLASSALLARVAEALGVTSDDLLADPPAEILEKSA